ncbi:DNA polymerase III subunit delta' [Aurantimonas sp. A2-1-M11]|uniref:DNA polymerase III subunit delta' n=1 Tax=Aurantimonas sp. A2-1-M11 TaxID=3113712 RepID=UPI002F9206F6
MSDVALELPVSHDDFDGVPPPSATPALVGHRTEYGELVAAERAGRLHHAWLFQGPRGVGKATTAFAFARHLLSTRGDDRTEPPAFDPSDPVMRQIALGTFPGLVHLTRPPVEKGTGFRTQITVEGVRKLNRFFQATGAQASWRVAIIDPADDMNRSAANALLKILEEPPARSVFLIMNHAPGRLLPTIRSRCRTLRFDPLGNDALAAAVAAALPGAGREEIVAAAALSEGSVRQAISLIAHGGIEIRQSLQTLVAADRPDWNTIHSMADTLTQKGREQAYEFLIAALLSATAEASEACLDAGDGAGAAALAALWQDETARLREAAAYNLDRKQALLTLFDRFYRCRATARAA